MSGLLALVITGIIIYYPANKISVSEEEMNIITRTSLLLQAESSGKIWESEISEGQLTVSDYVRTCLTGSQYLLQNKSDDSFAMDLSYVVYGNYDHAPELFASLKGRSRNYIIEKSLTDISSKYAPSTGFSDETGTQVIDVIMESPLQDDNGYVFGLRKISGEIKMEGSDARTDFYIDDSLRPGNMSVQEAILGTQTFSMTWDSRAELPGVHDVKVLMRTSDGRGLVVTGGEVIIPDFIELDNFDVVQGLIPERQTITWYVLDAKDNNAYINLMNMSGDVGVSLFDMYGGLIGTNDEHNYPYEVLRGRVQSMPSSAGITKVAPEDINTFYIKVERSLLADPSGVDLSYLIVVSKEAAINPDGNVVAVIDDIDTDPSSVIPDPQGEAEKLVLCKDGNGNEVKYPKSDLEFLPLNGFLTSLSFTVPGQDTALNIYPAFDSGISDFAFVSETELSELAIQCSASEGYAAKVMIVSNGQEGTSFTKTLDESISITPSRNVITIRLVDFDGGKHDYRFFLLSGKDSDGYDDEVLSQFPYSYQSGIWLMHNLQPEYQFVAFRTGIEWNDMIVSQSDKGKSLANEGSHPQWVESGSPVYDGDSWKAASEVVVKYFVDPRNFLTPTYIFQFEKLSFDSSIHTIEGIQEMVKNSFLDTDDPNYIQILYDAGAEAGISPYFLTSRIIQEMGREGKSKLASGTLEGYEGYFNYYNIGSTPNPSVENGAVINGARYAMWGRLPDEQEITAEELALLLPWTTEELAIRGGALWISSSYVDIGQDTLYFQKFDVIDNEDGLYMHQYAQNISMAYSEGARYYRAYLSQDMLDSPFQFIIPIYENMPDKFGALP
jgi:beta-N-acetylglucosaminidase